VIRAILVAAALVVAPTVVSSAEPEWLGYPTGVKEAAASKKPMAVFVGHWQDSVLDQGTKDLLSKSYVAVYVDPATAYGQFLIRAFHVANNGLIISTPGGSHQMYNLSGTVDKKELASVLAKYADPAIKVDDTETVIREKPPVRTLPPEWQVVRPVQYVTGST
jgi:hypothetical protein